MAQWTQLASGTTKTLRGVFSVSASMSIIVGHDGLVLGTTNGGMLWSTGNANTTDNLNKVFVYGLALPIIATVGNNGTMRASSNVGVSWNTWTPGTTQDIMDLFVHDPTVGTTITAVGGNGVILFSNNGGANWGLQLAPTSDRLNGVFFRDLLNGTIVGNSGKILSSTNGGSTWTPVTSGVSTDLNHVFFTSMNDGWLVGDGGLIMKTTDGGATWSSVTSPTTQNLNRLSFSDGSNGTAVGAAGMIIRTTDGGATWAIQNSGVSTELLSVFFVDANNGMAVGNSGVILRTTNGGTPVELQNFSATHISADAVRLQWTTATESENFGFEVQRRDGTGWETMTFLPGAGSSTQARSYTWTDRVLPASDRITYRLRQIDFDGSAEYSPVIVIDQAAPVTAATIDVWPNPVRGSSNLQVTLMQPERVHVRIYAADGRLVSDVFNGDLAAGIHTLPLHASGLPSGVYLAVLDAGGQRNQCSFILQ
jgi:photosystem II stability/assembly factor-like uncharacterized protein